MNKQFTKIIILYNPKSTGSSKENAVELKIQLNKRLKNSSIELLATKYAGHAEKIGAKHAKDGETLLVSSSGDGGFNELINGVLSQKDHRVTVCVLPSGNANDHFHATQSGDLVERIVAGKVSSIDVLKIEGKSKSEDWSRYAHSYIGAGVTAYIGRKLTEAELNPINEKLLVLRYFLRFSHVSLMVETWKQSKFYRYDSFVAANINKMSKIVKLDQDSSIADGRFEVYAIRAGSLLRLAKVLFQTSLVGKKVTCRAKSIEFTSKNRLEVQCDGEVFMLDARKQITITAEHSALKTVL